jgi:hypothetical protein
VAPSATEIPPIVFVHGNGATRHYGSRRPQIPPSSWRLD